MYNKELIIKFIEKYYLNGLVTTAELRAENNDLTTLFKNTEGNVRGEITLGSIRLPDASIGVYYTKELMSLMSILDSSIEVEYKGQNPDGSIKTLEFSDSKGREVIHGTSTLDMIDADGRKASVKKYEAKINLNNETIQDILKSFSALATPINAQTLTFVKKGDDLYAVFGYNASLNTDMVKLKLDAEVDDDFDEKMSFPAIALKEILSINGKSYDEVECEISIKGVMKLKFVEAKTKITAEYWVKKNAD